jgi:hypothetical protein
MRLPSQPNCLIVTSIVGLALVALNLNPMAGSSVANAAANPDSVNPCKLVTAAEELQIQISFSNDAGRARAKTEELKLADIAVT